MRVTKLRTRGVKPGEDEYSVVFRRPLGATNREVKEFIIDALESWGGKLDPQNPLFHSLRPVRAQKVTER